jgi:hypothetical protein
MISKIISNLNNYNWIFEGEYKYVKIKDNTILILMDLDFGYLYEKFRLTSCLFIGNKKEINLACIFYINESIKITNINETYDTFDDFLIDDVDYISKEDSNKSNIDDKDLDYYTFGKSNVFNDKGKCKNDECDNSKHKNSVFNNESECKNSKHKNSVFNNESECKNSKCKDTFSNNNKCNYNTSNEDLDIYINDPGFDNNDFNYDKINNDLTIDYYTSSDDEDDFNSDLSPSTLNVHDYKNEHQIQDIPFINSFSKGNIKVLPHVSPLIPNSCYIIKMNNSLYEQYSPGDTMWPWSWDKVVNLFNNLESALKPKIEKVNLYNNLESSSKSKIESMQYNLPPEIIFIIITYLLKRDLSNIVDLSLISRKVNDYIYKYYLVKQLKSGFLANKRIYRVITKPLIGPVFNVFYTFIKCYGSLQDLIIMREEVDKHCIIKYPSQIFFIKKGEYIDFLGIIYDYGYFKNQMSVYEDSFISMKHTKKILDKLFKIKIINVKIDTLHSINKIPKDITNIIKIKKEIKDAMMKFVTPLHILKRKN